MDGKYCDRATGEIKIAADGDHQEYMGPPAVDIRIQSVHIDTAECSFRASRSFPMEAILCYIMKVVEKKKLELDSVLATTYSIRVTLSHELTPDQFNDIAFDMANGIWDEVE